MKDNRESSRVGCDVKVGYTSQETFGQGYVNNLSAQGLFLETYEEFFIGQEIRFTIPYSNMEKHVKVKGKVVSIRDHGIGVAFLQKN